MEHIEWDVLLASALRNYMKSLPVEDRYCNDCRELQVGVGICMCDVEGLMWEYKNPSVDRPIKCILNGVKRY